MTNKNMSTKEVKKAVEKNTTTTTARYVYNGIVFLSKEEYLDYVEGLR